MSKHKSQINVEEHHRWGKDIPLSTPFVIYLEPCGHCNLRCKFCPYTLHSKELKTDTLTLELSHKIIDDIRDFPDKLKMLRVCGNGESLLNKNIVSILRYANKADIAEKIQFVSNGTLLKEETINEIPQHINMIVISIEGLSNDDYLEISGVKIDYDKFVANIKLLYESCNTHKCLLHLKINDLAVTDKDRNELFFSTFENYCHEISIENIVPLFPDMDYFSNEDTFRFDDGKPIQKRVVCPQIFKSLQISANGDVVPCCVDWKRINLLGNVNDMSLVNIWHGSKIRQLQNTHLAGNRFNIPLCQKCVMNEYSEVDNIDHMEGHAL